jgi:hypothetical protein
VSGVGGVAPWRRAARGAPAPTHGLLMASGWPTGPRSVPRHPETTLWWTGCYRGEGRARRSPVVMVATASRSPFGTPLVVVFKLTTPYTSNAGEGGSLRSQSRRTCHTTAGLSAPCADRAAWSTRGPHCGTSRRKRQREIHRQTYREIERQTERDRQETNRPRVTGGGSPARAGLNAQPEPPA